MPNEVFVFAAIATLFILFATLATTVLWLWKASPLPTSLVPAPLSLRVQRLFHTGGGSAPRSRSRRGRN